MQSASADWVRRAKASTWTICYSNWKVTGRGRVSGRGSVAKRHWQPGRRQGMPTNNKIQDNALLLLQRLSNGNLQKATNTHTYFLSICAYVLFMKTQPIATGSSVSNNNSSSGAQSQGIYCWGILFMLRSFIIVAVALLPLHLLYLSAVLFCWFCFSYFQVLPPLVSHKNASSVRKRQHLN